MFGKLKLVPQAGAAGVSFAVDDVVPAIDPLWQGSLAESAEIRANAGILVIPHGDQPCVAPEGYLERAGQMVPSRTATTPWTGSERGSSAREIARSRTFLHPLVQAVHLAFSQHRPLVLSPDSIWLTIAQGFGHHVRENAEALRERIVSHSATKRLMVVTDSLQPDRWPALVSQFSSLIRENSDPVLHETLICEFSTTTPDIKTAYEVSLLDTYQRYFEYEMLCFCGIPKVTLQGTVEDWQRIRDRIEVLATYGLEWWTSRLTPILDQFVATSKGKPNSAFWRAIYKPQEAYAAKLASGWIADLFPYLFGRPPEQMFTGRTDAEIRSYHETLERRVKAGGLLANAASRRNHVLTMPRNNWLLPASTLPLRGNGVDLNSFPSGLSRAPLELTFLDGSKKDVVLLGGFLGVSQSPQDNALAPVVSWAVVQEYGSEVGA
jgi:hypothetical protein